MLMVSAFVECLIEETKMVAGRVEEWKSEGGLVLQTVEPQHCEIWLSESCNRSSDERSETGSSKLQSSASNLVQGLGLKNSLRYKRGLRWIWLVL